MKRISATAALVVLFISLAGSSKLSASVRVRFTGVNLAGADFGEQHLPGTFDSDYTYPRHYEVDYFVGKGMNLFRLPFRWERLQRTQSAEFDAAELARLDDVVSYITGRGAYVLLDPHNYARYFGGVVGQGVPASAFADFWGRLAAHYKNNSQVIFGLVNEPNTMPTETWRDDANAAIAAIRAAGAGNLILVPGNAWTGAWTWNQTWYGTPNATVMLGITDPINNFAFELHQYLDTDGSGTSTACVSATIGSERVAYITSWLRQHGYRGFLGEFAGGNNDTCNRAMDDLLTYLDNNRDVWLGWNYWAAGPWWGEYIYTLEPTNCPVMCGDRPQMATLLRHIDQKPRSFDFDGDGKTDIGITRVNSGVTEWWLSRSSDSNVFSTVFGLDSDISAPGDFTGDGKTDIAVFRPSTGQWFVLRSDDFSFFAFPFGANGDIPVPADYDGDGKTDPAVFRPSSNTWFISRTSDGQTTIAQFGSAGDKPVPADYDGDGKADIAVYRLNNGAQEWWIQRSTAGLFATVFGIAGDKAVAGDYTGDGKADIAVWRPSNGNWFVLRSEDFSFFAFPWGANGDIPAPGDYDGDGKFDAAVFRQSGSTWYVNRTGGAGPLITGFGAATDSPVAGSFVR